MKSDAICMQSNVSQISQTSKIVGPGNLHAN